MSKKEKLIERLLAKPTDFTISEVETLLRHFGYYRSDKGKTSGSRIIFVRDGGAAILLHRPHPGSQLKAYQIKQLIETLR